MGAGLLLAAYGMLAVDRRAWRQLEAEVAGPAAAMGARLETVRRQAEPLTRAATALPAPVSAGFTFPPGLDPRPMEVATFEALGAVIAGVEPVLVDWLSSLPPTCVANESLWEKAIVSDVILGRGPANGAGSLDKWCSEVKFCAEEPLPDFDPRTDESFDFLEQCLMEASWGLPPPGDATWDGKEVFTLTTKILWSGRMIVARAVLRGDGATANQYLVRLAYLDAAMRAADNFGQNIHGPMAARVARQGRCRIDGLMLAVDSQVGIDEATADAIAGIYRATLMDDEDYAAYRRLMIMRRAASLQLRVTTAHLPSPGNAWTFFYDGKPQALTRRLLAPVVERELGVYTAALVAGEPSGADRARINSAWALYNGDPALITDLTHLGGPGAMLGVAVSAEFSSINRYPERCAHIALAIAHRRRSGGWPTQEQSAALLPEAEGEFLLCTGTDGEPIALHAHRHWGITSSTQHPPQSDSTLNPEHPSVGNIAGFPPSTRGAGDLEVYRLCNPWPALRRTLEAMLGGE